MNRIFSPVSLANCGNVQSHGIYTLIRLLLGHPEVLTEGEFTAARDSMYETKEWLQDVAIDKLDDVQASFAVNWSFSTMN
jgi:hypothetical protein